MKKKNSGKELLQKLGTLMALALLVLIFCVMMPDKFPRISNIMNIFKQASINCLIASGMLCALITAGIDLSVGSNCVLCTCTIGVLVQNFGITSMPLLIIAGLAVSTFAGFVNGILLTRLDLPHPFVSTMGMKNVLWGLALVITGSKSIAFTNTGVDDLMWIGGGSIGKTETFPGIPFSFILVLIVFCIFHVFLTRSALGRQIYCVGGNPEAARLSGIPSKNVLTFVYSLSGFMAGMAGVVSVGVVSSVVLLAQPASRPRQSTSARSSAMSCFMCFIFKPPDFLITRDVFSQLCCEKCERAGPFRRCFSFAYTLGYSTVLYYHKMRLKSTALSFFAKIFWLKKLKNGKQRTFLFIWLHR